MRAWGLLAFALGCASCQEVRIHPDEIGGNGGGGAPPEQPATRPIEVRMREEMTHLALPGAEVISSRLDGTLLERQTTGSDGRAVLQVEDGGTITTFWRHESSSPLPIRTATTYLVTPEVTSIEQRSITTSAIPNEPFRLVLELAPVDGAAAYLALAQCHPEPHAGEWLVLDQISGPVESPTLEADEVRGCPGQSTYSVFAMAVDPDLQILGYDYVVDAVRPQDGEAVHSLALDKHDIDVMNVTFEGVPDGAILEAGAIRRTAGLVAHDPAYAGMAELPAGQTTWQSSLLRVPIPVVTELQASFVDGCSLAWLRRLEPEPTDVSWNPTRLMAPALQPDGTVTFEAGESGDVVLLTRTEPRNDHARAWVYASPSPGPAGAVSAPARPSFPTDLEEAYGFDATAVGAALLIDVLGSGSYEAALAAGLSSFDASTEGRSAVACAR